MKEPGPDSELEPFKIFGIGTFESKNVSVTVDQNLNKCI